MLRKRVCCLDLQIQEDVVGIGGGFRERVGLDNWMESLAWKCQIGLGEESGFPRRVYGVEGVKGTGY
jgi:hypothetical protein